MGNASAEDGMQVGHPSVLIDHGVYKMWYFEVANSWLCQVAYATSPDGRNWTKHGAVLGPTLPGEGHNTAYPSVVLVAGTFWMFYDGTQQIDGTGYRIYAATSQNGVTWTKLGVVLDLGPSGSQDAFALVFPRVLVVNGTFLMWYTGVGSLSAPGNKAIMLAESANGMNWTKQGVVLSAGGAGALDANNVMEGSVAVDGSTLVMVYSGESANGTVRFLYAMSADGVHWDKKGLALAPDPPQETVLSTPDLLLLSSGQWNVYYAVRNGVGDFQIYLATGQASAPPNNPPSGTSPPGSVFGALATPVFVTIMTGAGVLVGVGVGAVFQRSAARRSR